MNATMTGSLHGWGGSLLKLAICLVACFGAAFLGSQATMPNLFPWYASLTKPSFNPPSWVFGPVWSVLYLAMAIAAWRIWLKDATAQRNHALTWFAIQLVLNTAWSWAFFGANSPLFGLIVIVMLLGAIIFCTILFRRLDFPAFLLMLPYGAWVGFATILNAALWRLNA